ncbi:hypothetical protein KUW04_17885 [Halomonas denitrificans]|nr:hypothetical protein [Halomonas denitrificans]
MLVMLIKKVGVQLEFSMDIEKFNDGSTIEWFSKESLLYKSGEYSVQIVCDVYKDGFFKTGREIVSEELDKWMEYPCNETDIIDENSKQDLISKAKQYFSIRGFNVRVV